MLTREPGGTPAGELIRRILLQNDYPLYLETEILLYMSARMELIGRMIKPALSEGRVVICDRFTDSSIAYQAYGAGGDPEWINLLNTRVTGGLCPHHTFLLDLPVENAVRRRGRAGDRIEEKALDFHHRVRKGFLMLAEREPERITVIDGTAGREEINLKIWQTIRPML